VLHHLRGQNVLCLRKQDVVFLRDVVLEKLSVSVCVEREIGRCPPSSACCNVPNELAALVVFVHHHTERAAIYRYAGLHQRSGLLLQLQTASSLTLFTRASCAISTVKYNMTLLNSALTS
jgi:hypothetical protein